MLRRGIAAALVTGPCLLVVLWLMFQHKPSWYRPATLDEAGLERARGEATGVADDVSDRIVQGEPFDLVLRDRAVNEWLAGLEGIWPDAQHVIPPELSNLATRFDGDRVRLGALCAGGRVRVILNAAFSVRVSDDGRNVAIALTGARSGSLPIPRAVLDRMLNPLLSQQHSRDVRSRTAAASGKAQPTPLESSLDDVRSVDDLFEGVKVRNRFIWPNGDRPFRIDSIKIDNGELHLRIEPL